jgi:arylamine N-acetyltransferase
MLASAGFRCYPVMADMKRANIHCALVVEMNARRYLVDPGYLVGEPVELTGEPVRIQTTFGVVELRPRHGERYDLFTLDGGDLKWRYTAKTVPVSHQAFMRYWQESFSLPMMNNMLLTRLTPQGHLYIKNHHLRMKGAGGKVNENIRSDFEARIAADFGISPEITAQAREHLERLRRSWRVPGAAQIAGK